ncbi:MAG: methyltransferase domain-containing protein [Phycisphaerales bacterium]|nr:methyltransferase domain-containing protein [Phycisphaerales bacterium]
MPEAIAPSPPPPAPPAATIKTLTMRQGSRLVMYHRRADSPEFWDSHWLTAPPRQCRTESVHHWFRPLFGRFLPRSGLIVEAGCGNGNVARTLRGAGYTIEGLDFAPRIIDANLHLDPSGRYLVGDVRALPYSDNSLAGYLSLGVVEHFDDDSRATILAETARVLRPGSAAIISVPYFSPLRRLHARQGGFAPQPVPDDLAFYQIFMTALDLARQLRAAGLHPVATDAYDIYKGIKDTINHKPQLNFLRESSPAAARLIDNPPRKLRLYCGHMLMIAAVKPA